MNKEIRILFTSVGRRVELMQAFKSAAIKLNIDLTLYGADISDTAPALYFCDRQIIVPCILDSSYITELLSVCLSEKIDCLIPTIDTDLLLLAENKERFTGVGTQVLISDPDKIQICRDKRLTSLYFINCGLKAPMPVDDVKQYSAGLPCFIKPLNGSSSINAFKVENQEDLELKAGQIIDYIIQPFISGTEYTVDILCGFNGEPLLITPRIRLAVRTGEVLKTQIRQDEKIIGECKKLIANFKPCGPMTVQLIRDEKSGEDYYIEINPRFGGGAPLSMRAGADAAEIVLMLLTGKEVEYQENAATDGAEYSRFDQSVCTRKGVATNPPKAIIFDLDDTLYPEKEYVKSGFKAVAKLLPEIENAEEKLWTAFEKRLPAIDTILTEAKLVSRKAECLRVYRSHKPEISLRSGMKDLLDKLRAAGFLLGVITDGRPEGQRVKIDALGLEKLIDHIIITDELGGAQFRKPCDIAFRIMQRRMGIPFETMVYVADNPAKDFIAPKQLGMRYMLFRSVDGLYFPTSSMQETVSIDDLEKILIPNKTIKDNSGSEK